MTEIRCPDERGAFKMSTSQPREPHVSASEESAAKTGVTEICARQVRLCELGVVERRVSKIDPSQICITERGALGDYTPQRCFPQLCRPKIC